MSYPRCLVFIAGLFICLFTGAAQAQLAPLPKLQQLAQDGARITAQVVNLDTNQVIAQLSPDDRLTPASVSKLFIGAAILEHRGPDSVFTTTFASNGRLRNGVLGGDLMLLGAGDPDFDNERLWLLITRLRQAGVRTVSGDLVVNDHLFGPVICLINDRCKARNRSDNAYDAPLSAAGINYSSIELSIIPAEKPGQPASLQLLPPTLAGVSIEGTIQTGNSNSAASYSVRRATEFGEHTLHVNGQVPLNGGPYYVQRSVAYPSRYTGTVLARMLADSGISVEGITRVDSEKPPADFRTLASVDSPSLAGQLRKMMTFSNNYMADVLTLDLPAYNNIPAPLTLPLAGQSLETYALDINQRINPFSTAQENDDNPLVLDSGSGLAITNRLSARDVTSLLTHMYHKPSLFPAFLGSLPVPLHSPSRSLKRGDIEWLTRIAAKTGSLTQPVSVRGLAGYFRLREGGWGAFAMIINGSERRRQIPYSKANQAIISDMESILAVH